MIVKSFEVNKAKLSKYKSILLYGLNKGFKEEIINSNISLSFSGEILRYEESEVLDNKDIILESFINGSLFGEMKLIIISIILSISLIFIKSPYLSTNTY